MAQDSISATNSVQACENIIDPEPFWEWGLFVSLRIAKTGFNCVYLCKIGLPVNKTKGEGQGHHCGSFTALRLAFSLNSWTYWTVAGRNTTKKTWMFLLFIENIYNILFHVSVTCAHNPFFSISMSQHCDRIPCSKQSCGMVFFFFSLLAGTGRAQWHSRDWW